MNGIGGLDSASIGIYNFDTSDYKINEFNEFLELTSLLGNVTQMDGEYYGISMQLWVIVKAMLLLEI